jgi:CheY-like chemotaxis protein
VLASISDMVLLKAQEKGIRYQVLIDPELPKKLLGDPLRLTRVLNNLAGNAVKFTEQGEVTVSAKMLALSGEQVAVRFCVQDTGIGLSPDQIGRIFTPFTQADSSTTRRYGGTGLGLSIGSQLVELMGGELRVESVEGEGSSFFFTVNFKLPAARDSRSGSASQQLRSLRLLVVDADPVSRARVADLLRGMPVSLVSVPTVAAALAALGEGELPEHPGFDLLLVDGATAGVAGIEDLCRSIASRHWSLPTLATATPDQLDLLRPRGKELGLTGLLATPARDSLLLDGIVRALSCGSRVEDPVVGESPPTASLPAAAPAVPLDRGGRSGKGTFSSGVRLEPARLAAETAKLERLLARNSLDAKRQFARFRQELPQGAFQEELAALELCMEKLDFKKARQLLDKFSGRLAEQPAQEGERNYL